MSTLITWYAHPQSFIYKGNLFSYRRRGSSYRLARTFNGDVVVDADSGLFRIRNWQSEQKIYFKGIKRRADLEYNPATGIVVHVPTHRAIVQLNSGLNPRTVKRSLRIGSK